VDGALAALSPVELRAVEYAALLPPDNVPVPWIRDLLVVDFPDLGRSGVGDPILALLKRLERLRLIVSQVRQREATPTSGAGPGDERLARMHRLVQDVVRERLDNDKGRVRLQVVYRHADYRGGRVKSHWGQPGMAWELPSLRDIALRRIDADDRGGFWLGDKIATPLLHSGRMLDVHDLWRKSAALFQRLAAAAPENADYAQNLSVSYNRLGDLAMSSGDPTAARRYFEDCLTIAKRLSVAAPANAVDARNLSTSYDKLGDLARSSGDPTAARRYYEDGLTIRKRLSAAAPENADYARDFSLSYDGLGDLAMSSGDPTVARRYYEDSLTIRKRLSAVAPENADYARDVWVSCSKMATLAEDHPSTLEARTWWLHAHDVLAGMKRRGMFVSPEDEGFLRRTEKKLGLS
jgi:tetratricopeptide (TPR) repeat protein